MNKKLKRYLEETDKANAKIAELQEYLCAMQREQKREEDAEIIKIIRAMKLPPKELFALLNGLQEGSLVIAQGEEQAEKQISEAEKEEKVQEAPESEDTDYEVEENS